MKDNTRFMYISGLRGYLVVTLDVVEYLSVIRLWLHRKSVYLTIFNYIQPTIDR